MLKENFDNRSKEIIIAKKIEASINNGKYPDLEFTTDNILEIREIINRICSRLPGTFSIEEVINMLIKKGVIKEPQKIQETVKKEKIMEEEIFKTDSEKFYKRKEVLLTEKELETIENNLLKKEAHNRKIFENSQELNNIYNVSLSLVENKAPKTLKDYLEFVEAGLVKPQGSLSPKQVVFKDFDLQEERRKKFEEDAFKDPIAHKNYHEAKQIATIVERFLAQGFTEGNWYGDKFKYILTGPFNDLRRIDGVVLIEKDNDENHDALGLGIDVTYRGLESEFFQEKFFTLLDSITDNFKTSVKYFKDHNGKMMGEFSIPRIVLSFNIDDVEECFDIIKSIGDIEGKEKIKNSYLKSKVINQIIGSCKILAEFSKKLEKGVFRDYYNVIDSITEVSFGNEEMQEMIKVDKNDKVYEHYIKLIEEYKNLKALGLRPNLREKQHKY